MKCLKMFLLFTAATWSWKIYVAAEGFVWASDAASTGIDDFS